MYIYKYKCISAYFCKYEYRKGEPKTDGIGDLQGCERDLMMTWKK